MIFNHIIVIKIHNFSINIKIKINDYNINNNIIIVIYFCYYIIIVYYYPCV